MRQGLIITIKQLKEIVKDLESHEYHDENARFQLNIVNNEHLSDTWIIEK